MIRLSLVLMLLFASPVRAGTFIDGNSLYEHCNKESDFFLGLCSGYVMASVDVLNGGSIGSWKACVPKGVRLTQIRDIVKRHLANNPQDRHYSADSLVAEALSKAFPC